MANELIIRTSEPGWFAALSKAYKQREPVVLIDDAEIGFDPSDETLLEIARKSKLGVRDIAGACIALGMSAVGVGLVVAAILDPEPISKLTVLVAGGIGLAATGGLTAVWILTDRKPPSVIAGTRGVQIGWES